MFSSRRLWNLCALSFVFVSIPGTARAEVQPKYESQTVRAQTPNPVDIDVDIKGAKQLFLVVTDAGDGITADWADWMEPRLIGTKGEMKLTDVKWKSAQSGWGKPQINKNADGGP